MITVRLYIWCFSALHATAHRHQDKVYFFSAISEEDLALWLESLQAANAMAKAPAPVPVSNSTFYQVRLCSDLLLCNFSQNDSDEDAEDLTGLRVHVHPLRLTPLCRIPLEVDRHGN
jgi:hypothetical protein